MPDEEPVFDLESAYDAEVAPLMDRVIAVCKAHGLPMFATFLYRHSEEGGSDFCSTVLPRGAWQHDAIEAAVRAVYRPRPDFTAFTITRGNPDDRP